MIRITCTNGNTRNAIKAGSRVRWTCIDCQVCVAYHYSPWHGPARYYESKHPTGIYAQEYNLAQDKADEHVCNQE